MARPSRKAARKSPAKKKRRSWPGAEVARSAAARDELLRVVQGGPAEQHVRRLLAEAMNDTEHVAEAEAAARSSLSSSFLPIELHELFVRQAGQRALAQGRFLRELEHRVPNLTADAALGRKQRRNNQEFAARSAGIRRDEARRADRQIAREAADYRSRHPHGREHSTRALAAHIARVLQRPEGTIRRRLAKLNLR